VSARKLLTAAVSLWFGRWLALELASFVGDRLLKPDPARERNSPAPGWMDTP
jgi:hypothetical protein